MLSSIHVQITPHIIIIIEDSTWEFNVNIKIAIAYQTKDIRNVLSHCINDQVWDIFMTANTYIGVILSLSNPYLFVHRSGYDDWYQNIDWCKICIYEQCS